MQNTRFPIALRLTLACLWASGSHAAAAGFTMSQVLDYPYTEGLIAAERADAIAWLRAVGGVRNVWMARGPDFKPVRVTNYKDDDGQEISQLAFAPDGSRLVYVRGGDHDANWPADGNLAPDPALSTQKPQVTLWAASLAGGEPVKIADGDSPAISSRGQLAYLKDDQVWVTSLDDAKPQELFFDRGKDADLKWSPDGTRLAFVSKRGDHSFIGIYASKDEPLVFVEPGTHLDSSPRWSPDGSHIAFVRQPGEGGPPEPILSQVPHPWSIWVAGSNGGTAHRVWQSPDSLSGSYPDVAGEANLQWAAGDRLVFLAYLDDWPHLYSAPAAGGEAMLLTPGSYMVEHVALSRDRRFVIYDANTGKDVADDDRRHIFRVAVDRPGATTLTAGESIDWTPVPASSSRVAYIAAGARRPPAVALVDVEGKHQDELAIGALPADFPLGHLIVPKRVVFRAADGTAVHGQLFDAGGYSKGTQPAVVFVHGGPPRQMMLGWHYMGYYSNAYAVNQYLANHGFVVLSVNYRLSIGYGRAFQQPDHAGLAGAAEYQDVIAGARYLQSLTDVDGARIGIWGGSYGGYLSALALARNSNLFRAAVDLHGVHDWSRLIDDWTGKKIDRYEQGDRAQAVSMAWESSPDASIASWSSPVLLIQGDDDRNVPFDQTVDLARRLDARHLPYEELVLPNEIHGFLRHASWMRADEATADFLSRKLSKADRYDAVVARPGRSDADVARDALDQPAALLRLAGIGPGMHVADVLAGGGYYSELAGNLVGPNGKVLLVNNAAFDAWSDDLNARLEGHRLPNVEHLTVDLDNMNLAASSLDAVLLIKVYHDLYWVDPTGKWPKIDADGVVAQLARALKPGGVLLLVDHSAKPGTGSAEATPIHRIDESFALKEFESHGLEKVATSDLLRRPDDPRDRITYKGEMVGKTDRFVIVFRKRVH